MPHHFDEPRGDGDDILDSSGDNIMSELWAIVEVMGHAQYAGRLSEYSALGIPLVRVEVPETDGQAAFDKLLGATAIFRITPCTEEVARAAARALKVHPLSIVAFPSAPSREDAPPPWLERT
jgi:hypothetical protein